MESDYDRREREREEEEYYHSLSIEEQDRYHEEMHERMYWDYVYEVLFVREILVEKTKEEYKKAYNDGLPF